MIFFLGLSFPSSFPNIRKYFSENFLKCNQTRGNIFLFQKLAFPGNMYFREYVLRQPNTALDDRLRRLFSLIGLNENTIFSTNKQKGKTLQHRNYRAIFVGFNEIQKLSVSTRIFWLANLHYAGDSTRYYRLNSWRNWFFLFQLARRPFFFFFFFLTMRWLETEKNMDKHPKWACPSICLRL